MEQRDGRHAPEPDGAENAEAKPATNRRDFLRLIGTFAVAAATMKIATATATAAPGEPEEHVESDQWGLHKWGMVIDVEKCIGCGSCVVACKAENHVPKEPMYFRTWVERYREYGVEGEETVVDSPNGGYDGFPGDDGERTPDRAFFVPKLCNACEKSPCSQVCPVGATFKTPDGAVLVDPKYCIGCRYCIQACPYGCRFLNPDTGVADKCTLCYHRIHQGLRPACVENCPTGARIFGDLKDEKSGIRAYLHDHKIFVLKPHLNTYPKVFYYGIDKEVR
jgi:Fe-S-cluster-containing dehydrogenase component